MTFPACNFLFVIAFAEASALVAILSGHERYCRDVVIIYGASTLRFAPSGEPDNDNEQNSCASNTNSVPVPIVVGYY
eukprot:scaffold5479_cov199-Amphora_coffeaeformis.AAC.48